MARPEKAMFEHNASTRPTPLKVLGVLDAIATPTTSGINEASETSASRSPNTTMARPTVESGSADLTVSTKLGAAMAMAAFVSKKPSAYVAPMAATVQYSALSNWRYSLPMAASTFFAETAQAELPCSHQCHRELDGAE